VEPIIVVLGGIVVAVVSGSVGKFIGDSGKVKDSRCTERRHSCLTLVCSKIDNLTETVIDLKKFIDKKIV